MANKKVSIDFSEVLKGLDEIEKKLNSIGGNTTLGKKLKTEVLAVKNEISGLKAPEAGASSKEITNYGKQIDAISKKMAKLSTTFSGANIKDSFLTSVSKDLQALKKEALEAEKALKDLKTFSIETPAPIAAADKTGTKGVLSTFNSAAKRTGSGNANQAALATAAADAEQTIRTAATTAGATSKKSFEPYQEQINYIHEVTQAANANNAAIITANNNVVVSNGKLTIAMERERNATVKAFDDMTKATQTYAAASKTSADQVAADAARQQANENTLRSAESLTTRIKMMASAASTFAIVRRVVRDAIQDFQELDKQFNEIAIVSKYSTKEMWDNFSEVNKMAQEYGVTTTNILEVQNLYYHQGKETAEVNNLTAQTLTLAKITGMDYADATNKLTAALNGYRIAAEDANTVTDSVAALDANAAISSAELLNALSKTASIAASAGMSLQSTEVFLTKMIETTREAPENLGTALKTIIARFGEVKQEIDGEEIELADINKVDTALKTVGISLLDTAGQIRNLDDVFMELSAKWDTLDRNTQRYIATISAGSRQQSRFIAMMENYDRTVELTNVAQNSAGTGASQLEESMDSLETALNRLKSSWQALYTSVAGAGFFRSILEGLNGIVSVFNTLNDWSPKLGALAAGISLLIFKTKILNRLILEITLSTKMLTGQMTGEQAAQQRKIAMENREYSLLNRLKTKIDEVTGAWIKNTKARKNANTTMQQSIATETAENNQLGKTATKQQGDTIGKLLGVDMDRRVSKDSISGQISSAFRNKFKLSDRDKKEIVDLNTVQKDAYEAAIRESLSKKGPEFTDLDKITGDNANKIKGGIKAHATQKASKAVDAAKASAVQAGAEVVEVGEEAAVTDGTVASLGSTMATAFSAALPYIAAVAAAVAATYAVWKIFFAASVDDTKAMEKLTAAQDKYNESLTTYNDLEKQAETVKKYSGRSIKSADEKAEEQDAIDGLIAKYPTLLYYIDEEGNAHIKNTAAIQEQIDKQKELLDQSETTYNKLRVLYSKKGIYADTSTSAGKSMSNLKDFYASTDKETWKEIAKEIDSVGNFDKSVFYDLAEAYKSGDKSSFNQEDFSNLFEGTWDKDSFNAMAEEYHNQIEKEATVSEAMKAAAEKLEGATTGQISDIVKVWSELNEQTGNLYSDLLSSISTDVNSIYVEEAKVYLDGELDEGANSEVTDALAKSMADYKEKTVKAIEDINQKSVNEVYFTPVESSNPFGGFSNLIAGGILKKRLGENVESEAQEETEGHYDDVVKAINENIDKVNESISGVGGLAYGETTIGDFEGLLADFVNTVVGNRKEEADEIIANIQTAYNKYQGFDSTLQSTGVGSEKGNTWADWFIKSGITYDQINGINDKMETLGEDGGLRFLNGFKKVVDEGAKEGLSNSAMTDLENTLLKTDTSDFDSIGEALYKIKLNGLDATEALQDFVDANGGLDSYPIKDANTAAKDLSDTISTLVDNFTSLAKIIGGTGTITDLGNALDAINKGLITKDTEELAKYYKDLDSQLSVTSDGIQISANNTSQAVSNLIESKKMGLYAEAATVVGKLKQPDLTSEEMKELLAQKTLIKSALAEVDVQWQKTLNDEKITKLERYKNKVDDLLDAFKGLVEWLREFDEFQNLDRVIGDLEDKYGHLEFEIEFSLNDNAIAESLNDTLNNLNSQVAANQAGVNTAKADLAQKRGLIQARNSEYVSFDESGNAVVNAKKLYELQTQIANSDEYHREALQAQYDEIMDNVDAYDKAQDKVEDYTSALEESLQAVEDFLKEQYEAVADVQDQIIEVIQQAEDRELEAVKEKYDKIKEENDQYLSDVQDMVNKERDIRNRANQEEDVKDKERKLAMMKMDSSGIYASQIKQLEDELEDDYQNLEDETVDQMISQLSEKYSQQAEELDKEVTYLENALNQKRELMTEYNAQAYALMAQGSDAVLAYLEANDQAYYTATVERQQLLATEWEHSAKRAEAANTIMAESLIPTLNYLTAAQQEGVNFEGIVDSYSEDAVVKNDGVTKSVKTLSGQYETLVQDVGETMPNALDILSGKYKTAATAAWDLYQAQQAVITGKIMTDEELGTTLKNNGLSTDPNPPKDKATFTHGVKLHSGKDATSGNNMSTDTTWVLNQVDGSPVKEVGINAYTNKEGTFYQVHPDGDYNKTAWVSADQVSKENDEVRKNASLYWKKYATGGMVDYTGPAWVDGTKSQPEAFLSAVDTSNIAKLRDVLQLAFNRPSAIQSASKLASSQNSGDSNFNIHIDVEKIADDYDVEKMVTVMQEKITDAAKYRNVTVVTKKN